LLNIINKIAQADAKRMITKELYDEWQIHYNESEKGLNFKNILPSISKKPWFDHSKFNAEDIKIMNRLITNHSYDKRWLHRFGKIETELCDHSNLIETAEHIIFKCKKYNASRRAYHHLAGLSGTEDLWRFADRNSVLREIIRFIKENDIIFKYCNFLILKINEVNFFP
jgi:hypothetical protein